MMEKGPDKTRSGYPVFIGWRAQPRAGWVRGGDVCGLSVRSGSFPPSACMFSLLILIRFDLFYGCLLRCIGLVLLDMDNQALT